MRRSVWLFGLMLAVTVAAGQDGESLTEEFPGLSARERSRIAKREAAEAPRDEAFQRVMRTADELFQAGRYEEALDRYLEARRIRPYNVYPKVKAQDLQALLERRAAMVSVRSGPTGEEAPRTEAPPQEAPPGPAPVPDPVPTPVPAPVAPPPLPTPTPAADGPPAAATARAVPSGTRHAGPTPMPDTPRPDGLQELRYREGRADVLERRVTSEGRTTTYKRVRHPWGAVFHFKDGEAMSANAWEQLFPEDAD